MIEPLYPLLSIIDKTELSVYKRLQTLNYKAILHKIPILHTLQKKRYEQNNKDIGRGAHSGKDRSSKDKNNVAGLD